MSNKTLPILTDRSRIESYQSCPRKRFYAYEINNRGLQSTRLSLPLLVGSMFHYGVENILKDIIAGLEPAIDLQILNAQIKYDEQVSLRGLLTDPNQAGYAYFENRALIEVLIRVWAKVGLPELLREYEVLEVEKEIDVPLFEVMSTLSNPVEGESPQLILMTRPDAILRHRLTGNIVVLSFKTASEYKRAQEKKNKWDNQSIGEMLGVEYWLQSEYGEGYAMDIQEGAIHKEYNPPKVSSTRMEYVIKGLYSKAEKDHAEMGIMQGQRYYSSNPILHPFSDMTAIGEGRYEAKWNITKPDGSPGVLGKNWKKINAWEQGEGFIKDWIDHLYEDEWVGRRILQEMVVNPVEFSRNDFDIARWKRQVIKQELRIHDAMQRFDNLVIDGNNPEIAPGVEDAMIDLMDEVFPLNPQSCVSYTAVCQFADLCWNQTPVEMKVQFGDLQPRESNHLLEKENE